MPRGRPPILDEDITRRVADIVRAGNYAEVAAASVGINADTFYRWLREGSRIRRILDTMDDETAADNAYEELTTHQQAQVDFSEAIEKARAEAQTIAVMRINKAGHAGAWQADMTRLERTDPKRWGRRESVEVSGQLDGVHIQTDSPTKGIDASQALRDARAADLAADLIEHLAGTNNETKERDNNE